MKTKDGGHSTNYHNTFIEIAEDCPITQGEMPPVKDDKKTIANLHFDMVYDHPYEHTSDDVIFAAYAAKNEIPKRDWPDARKEFFSKGQACMRASPLTKRYGFGVHSDEQGRIAIYGAETKEYKKFAADKTLEHTKAMRSKRS